MAELAEQGALGLGVARVEFPHLGVEQIVEEERAILGAVGRRGVRFKPAPLLGFLAGHKRPTNGLSVCEDPGLDGLVFSGCGHGLALTPGFLEFETATGAILRTIESDRFVTGMTWDDGGLWHGTWEGDESELRQVDPESGTIRQRLRMPPGIFVSGLESDGKGLFYCGGGPSGKLRAVRKPERS